MKDVGGKVAKAARSELATGLSLYTNKEIYLNWGEMDRVIRQRSRDVVWVEIRGGGHEAYG